jgi:hypothetical protein
MNKIVVLVIGALLIYMAASGRLQAVWTALTGPIVSGGQNGN